MFDKIPQSEEPLLNPNQIMIRPTELLNSQNRSPFQDEDALPLSDFAVIVAMVPSNGDGR